MVPHLQTEIPGPKSREYLEMARRHEPRSIGEQAPVVWDHADGATVTDVDSNVFIDFTSGVLVTNIGHSHPEHVAAVQQQAGEVMNSYSFVTPWRAKLAQKLVEITPPSLDRAFLLTTGSEATEAAIKIARRATGRHEVICFHGSFHGRTFGAMAAGGSAGVKKGFGPALPGFLHAPFPYCYRCPFGSTSEQCKLHTTEYLDWVLKTESVGDVAALIVEPYQGGAGSIMAPPGWLKKVFDWCQERDIVFILDEVQSSFGRTGTMFAFEHEGFVPNLLCLGKGIGSGVPLAAVVGESRLMDALDPGSMSSTNGGNPLSCRAALTAIEIMERDDLPERAAKLGEVMAQRLGLIAEQSATVGDVRGQGLVWGLELVRDKATREPAPDVAKEVVLAACRRGLLLISPIGVYGNVLRIAPPLVIEAALLDKALDILEKSLQECA
jgi:4-aminobutyrate aminotransferase / (S)-3-amino-2-methylpropionate transaminase / 5-aminovalerate transaminase